MTITMIKLIDMKTLRYVAIAAIGAGLLAGCGKSKNEGASAADTLAADTINPADEAQAWVPVPYLTSRHIGPADTLGVIDNVAGLHIGMPVSRIPDSIPGLYNLKRNADSRDAVVIEFLEDGVERFVAYDFGEGNIDVINVIGGDVKVKTLKGDISLGSPMADVLNLPGVEAEWSSYDDNGMWYWTWQGLWFAPDQENLSTGLSHRLYHSGQAPTMKDFEEDAVTVGFIGTGLPF